jgi:hypothetical protein
MLNYNLLSGDLWEPTIGEQNPNKLIVTEKILKKARNYHCPCIFCALKGDDKKNEELIENVIINYVANFEKETDDYIPPISLLEIIIRFVSEDVDYYRYDPVKNNLTPIMKVLLNTGFSQSEMGKILEKFTYKPPNNINNDSDDLPF